MKLIETLKALETLHGAPGKAAQGKVASRMTKSHRAWIAPSLLRAGLWHDGDRSGDLPTVGDDLREQSEGALDSAT